MIADVEEGVQAGPAQIRIDEQHIVAPLSADEGEIGEGGGFAFTRAAADDGDAVGVGVFAIELEVGAQDSVGLGIWGEATGAVQPADVTRDHGKDGYAQVAFDIVKAAHGGVEGFETEGEADAKHEAKETAEGEVDDGVGFGRFGFDFSLGKDGGGTFDEFEGGFLFGVASLLL